MGQAEKLMVFDYNFAKTMKNVHGQLEHTENSKTFEKIKELYYEIDKQIVEWLLKHCTVFLNHCYNNT